MADLKFIVLRCTHGTVKFDMPFIFPNNLVHAEVAALMTEHLKSATKFSDVEPVSAGTCNIDDIACHGASETLLIKARGDVDERLIKTIPYLHGVVGCY